MKSHFFAYMSRMKNIMRWGLMRNTYQENIQEHSLQVAMIAHALAIIENKYYGGDYDPNYIMALAAFHEASEVITGDLATPIKYFNPKIRDEYKKIETIANQKLLNMLPIELQMDYEQLIHQPDDDSHRLVKAADKIAAYCKCVEELKAGNNEFIKAKDSLEDAINNMDIKSVEYFMETFADSFELTIDELN